MQNTFRYTQYRIPRLAAVTYRVTDAADRVLGYVLPFLEADVVVWRCRTPYVPFAELPGDHPTRDAAAAHLAFLASVRLFRREAAATVFRPCPTAPAALLPASLPSP